MTFKDIDNVLIWITMVLVLLFVISFAVTVGPLAWIYLTEIMTEKGMGIAVSLHWMVIVTISLIPTFSESHQNKVSYSWLFFSSSGC